MLDTIADFVGNVAIYVTALLGIIALYYLWGAFREWRVAQRATFGIERDIAISEMIGALARAGFVVVIGVFVFALGRIGQESEPTEEPVVQPTAPSIATVSEFGTPAQDSGPPAPTLLPTNTSPPAATDLPSLPAEGTQAPPVEPTPQTARVTAFGGVWLRDAPNGGTIAVLPQESIVQFLEGREFAGDYDWQRVQVLNAPPASEGLIGQQGWVAAQFLEVSP